eukprot:gnl/TRDRNA2_/TRDRNA2_176038_c1_seq17.p1 gnl/TRDRNA2_/TRDRNA2_176038_c1~~gnl/TRDRNA2_/TRDRNA2_176038_c1_seq17.p1  ORF type:complete len:130 (+),score=53.37 gnl/TRDRNA2_/TRDRNA2_176038_c1_seq17:110-499(+)
MRTLLFVALLCGASAQLGERKVQEQQGGLYDLFRLANDPEVADHAEVKAEAEKARAARAAALPKLVAAAEKAEGDAKKLVSLALEADVAFEEGQMELKKTLAANMKAEQAKMRAQRLASTVAEMKAQGV